MSKSHQLLDCIAQELATRIWGGDSRTLIRSTDCHSDTGNLNPGSEMNFDGEVLEVTLHQAL